MAWLPTASEGVDVDGAERRLDLVELPIAEGLVIPIVTPEEMGAIDAAAPEPVDVLIAGPAGPWPERPSSMLGGTYGRRVVVLAGKGNNGNDGREAARAAAAAGRARVREIDAADAPSRLPAADLVIDAGVRHRVPGRVPTRPAVPGAAGPRRRHPLGRRRAHRRGERRGARGRRAP